MCLVPRKIKRYSSAPISKIFAHLVFEFFVSQENESKFDGNNLGMTP